jgi:hypothetical protein
VKFGKKITFVSSLLNDKLQEQFLGLEVSLL